MKRNKKRPVKDNSRKHSAPQPQRHPRSGGNHKAVDREQLAFEIEVGIFEVDKIFEGQGDRLNDAYVADSLQSFVKLIKDNSYALYADKLKEGSDDESDMLHINIVNRLTAIIEELELQVTDSELIEVVKQVLARAKKAKSPKSPRSYLDPLAKRLKEMGFRSDFMTEADVDGETIRLEDIDNLDDLGLDEDDELDLDDLRPRY